MQLFQFQNQWWVGLSALAVAIKIAEGINLPISDVLDQLVSATPDNHQFAEESVSFTEALQLFPDDLAPCIFAVELVF